jgi:competence protein ComFC
MLIRTLYRQILDSLFPRFCVHCGRWMRSHQPSLFVCEACRPGVEWIRSPYCPVCGYPMWGTIHLPLPCPKCAERKHRFTQGRALFLHMAAGASLVYALKYRRGLYLRGEIQRMLRLHGELGGYFAGAVLVPVPLHPRKLRERGYNQSELIAQAIADAYPTSRVEGMLVRVRDTASQTTLNAEARRRNMRRAFALAPGVVPDRQLPHVLIDDVFTTGSTLDACTASLQRHGIAPRVFTLAHG